MDDLETDALHPDHEEVERAFVEAIRRVGVELLLSSERGGDTVAAVRHRTSGRRGLRLVIQPECLDKLDGDALARLRVDLVTAVGGVVAHRAQRETGALAPDLGWDPRWGFTLVCWWIGAPGATPPGDGVLERGVNPSPAGLYRLMCGLEDWTEQLEVQVAPKTPADHDAVVEAVSVLAAQGQSVFGARPRWLWLRGEQGIQATFAPVWHIRLEGMTPETLVDMVERIAAHESVGGVRIVPGEPVGLEESWAVADVAWIWVESICVMRVRDGVSDRDLLIDTTRRIRTERDAEVERELSRAFTGLPGQLVVRRGGAVTRPMEDASGRQGLEVVFDASISRNWSMWAWALQGMARGCGESLLPVMTSGLAVEGPRLQVWFRRDVAG